MKHELDQKTNVIRYYLPKPFFPILTPRNLKYLYNVDFDIPSWVLISKMESSLSLCRVSVARALPSLSYYDKNPW